MSDIQEEQKRLYKRAEENDIRLLQERIITLENQLDFIAEQNKYIDKLENRINKIIEELKETIKYNYVDEHNCIDIDIDHIDYLLNILQGSDKE